MARAGTPVLLLALTLAQAPANAASSPDLRLPAWLAPYAVEAVLRIDEVTWQGTRLRALDLPLSIAEGRVLVRAGRARLGSGRLTLDLRFDPMAGSELHAEGRAVALSDVPTLAPYVDGTPVDFTLALAARGSSLVALTASTEGHFGLQSVGEGTLPRRLEKASRTVFGTLVSAFNPFRSDDEVTVLECLALDMPIHGGRFDAAEGMALRTRRMRIAGGGVIDLGVDRIDLTFTPEARRGVDLKSLNVVEAVVVEGSLAAPEVRIDSGNLLRRAATLGASVAIIGGSALRAALGKGSAPGTLCPP